MRKAIILGIVLAFALMAFAGKEAAAGAAAMIIKVSGDVKVQRDDKQKAIKSKFPLQMGDKVVVADGSSALILFSNGKKVTASSDMEINEEAMAIEGKEVGAVASASGMLMDSVGGADKNADLKAKGGIGGAVRAAAKTEVQLLSYLNTTTLDTRPVFAWEPSAEADSSEVVLMDEDGEVVWSSKTEEKLLAYPEDKDPLEQGMEYTYEVKSVIDGEEVSAASTFYIFDEDEAEEISTTITSIKKEYAKDDDVIIQHMLLSQYYKEQEMYMDAIDELKSLIAMDEYDVASRYELAEIYDTIGNKDAFKAELAKIEEIEKEIGDPMEF